VGEAVGVEATAASDPDDPRNRFTGRTGRVFEAYVCVVTAVGLLVVAWAVVSLDVDRVRSAGPAFWVVAVMLVGAELRPLFTAGSSDANGIPVSVAFLFALLIGYGSPLALVSGAVAVGLSGVVYRRAPWRTGFNVAQYALSWAVAGEVLGHTGSAWLRETGSPTSFRSVMLVPAAVAAVAFFVTNQLLVAVALSLKTGERMRDLLRSDIPQELVVNAALLALSPLVLLAMDAGVGFVPLLAPPLFAVYKVSSIALQRERQALTDPLTGLANRGALAEATGRAVVAPDAAVALLLFDLDRFKEVNDTLGHHVGDRLLQVVADRLRGAVRSEDTVARLGGDEFAVLLTDVADADAALETAHRLRDVIADSIVLEGVLVDVGASVGVAVVPDDGTVLDDMLQRADVAMYLAKETGTGVERYDAERDQNSTRRLALVGELRRALSGNELVLHYQPKVRLSDGRLVGVEALVRWNHAERGLLAPDEFVPAAERSGLIGELTAWVVDTALAQVAAWREEGLDLRVAVNVSARDLAGERLVDVVDEALRRHGCRPEDLVLEITEGSLLADRVRTAAVIARLDALGVALSLDDFGTGWSSLSYLRRLPVREIKIDRSFVQRLDADPRDLAIVRSIVDLAAGLRMDVVAEGVETERAWAQLGGLGCDFAQGWLIARAQPADRLTAWAKEHAAVPGRRSAD
jgi:diguanylate cyclase (GGDEF)-like protein